MIPEDLQRAILNLVKTYPIPLNTWFKLQMNIFQDDKKQLIISMPTLSPLKENKI